MAAKNLTDADLTQLEFQAGEVLEAMRIASDKLGKLRTDTLEDPTKLAKFCAVYARAAADLAVQLLNQAAIQHQRAEIERLRQDGVKT